MFRINRHLYPQARIEFYHTILFHLQKASCCFSVTYILDFSFRLVLILLKKHSSIFFKAITFNGYFSYHFLPKHVSDCILYNDSLSNSFLYKVWFAKFGRVCIYENILILVSALNASFNGL